MKAKPPFLICGGMWSASILLEDGFTLMTNPGGAWRTVCLPTDARRSSLCCYTTEVDAILSGV